MGPNQNDLNMNKNKRERMECKQWITEFLSPKWQLADNSGISDVIEKLPDNFASFVLDGFFES